MSLNYSILEQTTDQLREIENSPSVSMWPYLVDSAQTELINKISVYTEAGKTAEQARLLYMNAIALEVWDSMKRATARIGEVHRPPRSAQLSFGMPFSE